MVSEKAFSFSFAWCSWPFIGHEPTLDQQRINTQERVGRRASCPAFDKNEPSEIATPLADHSIKRSSGQRWDGRLLTASHRKSVHNMIELQ